MLIVVFFFKQKTAYEMRISDWSSDVCSSDLAGEVGRRPRGAAPQDGAVPDRRSLVGIEAPAQGRVDAVGAEEQGARNLAARRVALLVDKGSDDEIGRASGRERVCPYV